MLRDHLYAWRRGLHVKNYDEYLDRVAELPEEDRECAAALWGLGNKRDIMVIITAFMHVENWRTSHRKVAVDAIVAAAERNGMDAARLMMACGEDPDRLNNGGLNEAAAILLEQDNVNYVLSVIANRLP
jgi:hypothetical protein